MPWVKRHWRNYPNYSQRNTNLGRIIALIFIFVVIIAIIGFIINAVMLFLQNGGWIIVCGIICIICLLYYLRYRDKHWQITITDHNWHNISKRHLKLWVFFSGIETGRTLKGKMFMYRRNIGTGKYQVKLQDRFTSAFYNR